MQPKNGLDFKAARRPYFLADEVSYGRYERFALPKQIVRRADVFIDDV